LFGGGQVYRSAGNEKESKKVKFAYWGVIGLFVLVTIWAFPFKVNLILMVIPHTQIKLRVHEF
jgi:hypothetical protein